MALPTTNYSQVTAVTRKYFVPKMIDNIFNGNPLLNRAKSKGWLKLIDGGSSITMPLEYAVNGAADWYSGADVLTIADTDTFTGAELNWKQLFCPIVVTRKDELKNKGTSQVIDFVKGKVKNAEKTMNYKLSTGLYSAGTDADSIVGLRSWINTDETVGGISQSTNSWWQGQEDGTTTTLTIPSMNAKFQTCSEGNDSPTVIIGTKAVYGYYYNLLQPQQRFVDSESAGAGFTSLMFNGIPVLVDSNAPAYHMFFLNENYLNLFVHKEENMRTTDFEEPINQNVRISKIFWMGEFGISNNARQGSYTALTA